MKWYAHFWPADGWRVIVLVVSHVAFSLIVLKGTHLIFPRTFNLVGLQNWNVFGEIYSAFSMVITGALVAQSSMLGLWAGLTVSNPLLRFAGVITGSTYAWFGIDRFLCNGGNSFIGQSASIVAPCIMLGCVVIKWWSKTRLTQFDASAQPDRFQFRLWQLMVGVFVFAVLFALAKYINEHDQWANNHAFMLERIAWWTLYALSFLTVAIVSIWSGLSKSHTTLRTVAGVVSSIFVGVVLNYSAIKAFAPAVDWNALWDEVPLTLAQYLVMLASLGVMKACGYGLAYTAKVPSHREQVSRSLHSSLRDAHTIESRTCFLELMSPAHWQKQRIAVEQ